MPDGVVEYRCPDCAYQIPLLAPGPRPREACPECLVDPAPEVSLDSVNSSGLLNLLFCGSCGRLIGRYWGLLGMAGA